MKKEVFTEVKSFRYLGHDNLISENDRIKIKSHFKKASFVSKNAHVIEVFSGKTMSEVKKLNTEIYEISVFKISNKKDTSKPIEKYFLR